MAGTLTVESEAFRSGLSLRAVEHAADSHFARPLPLLLAVVVVPIQLYLDHAMCKPER